MPPAYYAHCHAYLMQTYVHRPYIGNFVHADATHCIALQLLHNNYVIMYIVVAILV